MSEPLERRRLLSVSAAALIGPIDVPGTHWEYASADGNGNTATFIETVAGPTTFNGNACDQINVGPTGASHTYEAFDGAGNLQEFGGFIAYPGGNTQTDTFRPTPSVPAQLVAGMVYTDTYTDTEVTVASTGTTTDTDTDTDTTLLVSDTTSSIAVPAGTYDAYEIKTTDTDVTPSGDGTTTSDTTTTTEWAVPGIGMVKATEYGSDGSVEATFNLSVFTTTRSKLAFTQQPGNAGVGTALKPAVTVAVEDADGNVKTAASGSVTLALAGGDGTATLSGTLTEPVVDGVATFSDLSVDKGGAYTLTATDVDTTPAAPATSVEFTIAAGTLKFAKAPKSGNVNQPLAPAVTVELRDSRGKLVTTSDGTTVTLSASDATGTAVAVGGNTATLSGGRATFTGLTIKHAGAYTLTAADGSDGDGTSGAISIAPDKLKFAGQPKTTDINAALPLSIQLVDSKGRRVTGADGTAVTLSLNVVKGPEASKLSGATQATVTNGVATFTADQDVHIGSAGTFTLTATAATDGITPSIATTPAPTDTTPVTSSKFKVIGPTLKSIVAAIGSDKATSTDDGLAITDANVSAALVSNGQMSFTAVGLSPATSTVLAGIGWAIVRNTDDQATGAAPAITQEPANRLAASMPLSAVGSFNVICYYDADASGTYDAGEELKVFHVALVGITVKPGGVEAANSTGFHVTRDGLEDQFSSGGLGTQGALVQMDTEQLVGGGSNGMIGVDQIHTGFAQDGTTDTAMYHYGGGRTEAEALTSGSFPIVDSLHRPEDIKQDSDLLFGPPLNPRQMNNRAHTVDRVDGADPAGGQDREADSFDSPALNSNNTGLTAADGTLGFVSYLAAYSTSFDKSLTGYVRIDWSAIYNYSRADTDGATWQDLGSHVDVSSATLPAPVTLDSVGFVTTGPVYNFSVKHVNV